MRKKKFIAEQQRNRMLETSGINSVAGANLISVDIQPEYQNAFDFNLYDYLEFLNENFESLNKLTFLYNGDSMSMVTENEYQMWLIDNGFNEDLLYYCNFYDKGYAFFRYCMDEGIEDDDIVALVKFMMNNNINDSRDITTEHWNQFVSENQIEQSEARDLLEASDDMINIPELMDELKNYYGKIVICGGGINECMKEVEIALMVLDKQYNVLTKYTY